MASTYLIKTSGPSGEDGFGTFLCTRLLISPYFSMAIAFICSPMMESERRSIYRMDLNCSVFTSEHQLLSSVLFNALTCRGALCCNRTMRHLSWWDILMIVSMTSRGGFDGMKIFRGLQTTVLRGLNKISQTLYSESDSSHTTVSLEVQNYDMEFDIV